MGGNLQTLVGRKTGGIKVRWRESLDVMRKSDLPLMVFFKQLSLQSETRYWDFYSGVFHQFLWSRHGGRREPRARKSSSGAEVICWELGRHIWSLK